MHRSIGKKILAVVAGVGLATAGLTVAAPAASAAEICSERSTNSMQTSGKDAWLATYSTIVKEECEADGYTAVQVTPYESPRPGEYWNLKVVGMGNLPATGGGGDGGNVDGNLEDIVADVLQPTPPPPPCWTNFNCPVGGAIQAAVPEYMIAGVPQTLVVYAAWRPDASTQGAPTNGDAVISMDGEPVAAAPFVDGVATLKFTPKVPGVKNAQISGVLNSNTSGANAWIDTIDVATMVLPYDPELLEEALKNKKVEVGDTYTLEEVAQAKTALGKRLEWRVAQDSSDVCAVTTTKKGEVKAKFTESGKCSIIWTDPKTDEDGKYTFKVTA